MNEFEKRGAVVFGISPDTPEAQKKFEEKQNLGIRLLADPDKSTLTKYGAFGEKKMYGKVVQGVIRSTFLIDPQGNAAKVWKSVKVDGHAEAVLEALGKLSK